MTLARISPAQRNLLSALVHKRAPLPDPLPHKTQLALDALQHKELIDAQQQPTKASRAFFVPTAKEAASPARTVAVWHLVGPQASGKTRWANAVIAVAGRAILLDAHAFRVDYDGNPAKINRQRTFERLPDVSTVLIEHNDVPEGTAVPHYMRGDRVLRFYRLDDGPTDVSAIHRFYVGRKAGQSHPDIRSLGRRPGIEAIAARIAAQHPDLGELDAFVLAKAEWINRGGASC